MERQTWSNVLSAALARGPFSPNEMAQIDQWEMEARTFFEWAGIVPDFFVLYNIEREETRIRYDWASRSRDAVCPRCDTISQTPAYEYVDQPWQDLPQDGRAVWHHVRRVEPYRDIVIREVQRGGNHRTIHPLLQQQFTGSANTVYQYILKLRQEIPEALHPVAITPPADLQLQQIARNTVYKAVLKRAADTRPTEAKSESEATVQPHRR